MEGADILIIVVYITLTDLWDVIRLSCINPNKPGMSPSLDIRIFCEAQ